MIDSKFLSATFPISGDPAIYCFPGAVLSGAGCTYASGAIRGLSIGGTNANVDVKVEIHDARTQAVPYKPFQSASRRRFEIDVTGAVGRYGNFNVYGTAITGGPVLANPLWSYIFQSGESTNHQDIDIRCPTGMIIVVDPDGALNAGTILNVQYAPFVLGGHRLKLSINQNEHQHS